LTDKQIAVITSGMRSNWGRPEFRHRQSAFVCGAVGGNTGRGEVAYRTYCESATAPLVAEAQRAARSPMILFSRSSAIKGYARL